MLLMQFLVGKCEVMGSGTKSIQALVGLRAVWNTDQSMVKRAHAALGKSHLR